MRFSEGIERKFGEKFKQNSINFLDTISDFEVFREEKPFLSRKGDLFDLKTIHYLHEVKLKVNLDNVVEETKSTRFENFLIFLKELTIRKNIQQLVEGLFHVYWK